MDYYDLLEGVPYFSIRLANEHICILYKLDLSGCCSDSPGHWKNRSLLFVLKLFINDWGSFHNGYLDGCQVDVILVVVLF